MRAHSRSHLLGTQASIRHKQWSIYSTFLRKLHPSVSRALPPVGWQSTVEQPLQMTTVCAWLKTVVLWT